jgi:hypothetical protein
MSARTPAIILAAAVLSLVVVLSACAPKPSAVVPPAKPVETNAQAAPAEKPPAVPSSAPAPVSPVAAPKADAKPTSFESSTYNNDQYGFTVRYPKAWSNDALSGDMIMHVAAQAGDLQSDAAAAAVVNKPSDYGKAIKGAVDAILAASNVPAKTKVESVKATTLSDGKTPATEVVLSADILGMYELYVYALGADKGDKTIAAIGLTIKGDSSKALVREIAQTLSFK